MSDSLKERVIKTLDYNYLDITDAMYPASKMWDVLVNEITEDNIDEIRSIAKNWTEENNLLVNWVNFP